MRRMRIVLAAAGVLLALLGVGTALTMRGDGSSNHAVPTSIAPASTGTDTPGAASSTQPSAEEVQRIIAGLTSQILAPADTSASTKPLTKEQVEAQLREQLKLLGITY